MLGWHEDDELFYYHPHDLDPLDLQEYSLNTVLIMNKKCFLLSETHIRFCISIIMDQFVFMKPRKDLWLHGLCLLRGSKTCPNQCFWKWPFLWNWLNWNIFSAFQYEHIVICFFILITYQFFLWHQLNIYFWWEVLHRLFTFMVYRDRRSYSYCLHVKSVNISSFSCSDVKPLAQYTRGSGLG